MVVQSNVELEAAKFLHKVIQESKDEPKELARKLYVILQHMRSSGKEDSMRYQVISSETKQEAAVRSRDRKKMYVRDLGMKSKYFEGEFRRLGMLLQWCSTENQALILALQNAKVIDSSRSK